VRLTADGKFHLCLLNDDEVGVRMALRSGNGDGGIEAVKRTAEGGRVQADGTSSARRELEARPM
jgi:molybdenum cofactor biosynthesis enzyme MoaA